MAEALTLVATVRDASGAPLPGVAITLNLWPPVPRLAGARLVVPDAITVTTDAEGRIKAELLPGTYTARIVHGDGRREPMFDTVAPGDWLTVPGGDPKRLLAADSPSAPALEILPSG